MSLQCATSYTRMMSSEPPVTATSPMAATHLMGPMWPPEEKRWLKTGGDIEAARSHRCRYGREGYGMKGGGGRWGGMHGIHCDRDDNARFRTYCRSHIQEGSARSSQRLCGTSSRIMTCSLRFNAAFYSSVIERTVTHSSAEAVHCRCGASRFDCTHPLFQRLLSRDR